MSLLVGKISVYLTKMIFYQLINSLSDNLKRKFKYLETTKCKVITKKWSIEHNKICLKEKILPNYTINYSSIIQFIFI